MQYYSSLLTAFFMAILHTVCGTKPPFDVTAVAQMFTSTNYSLGGVPIPTYMGEVRFTQKKGENFVTVYYKLQSTLNREGQPLLTAGSHGFHIHQLGHVFNTCGSTGGHYNPDSKQHGNPKANSRHVGDLGNIQVQASGAAESSLKDNVIQLYGRHSIVGRAVVVHAGVDDLGAGGDAGSLSTGNAGGRVACGVIGIASQGYESVSGATSSEASLRIMATILGVTLLFAN